MIFLFEEEKEVFFSLRLVCVNIEQMITKAEKEAKRIQIEKD